MKRILLSILTITAFSAGVNAQDSTAFEARDAIFFPPPAPGMPESYATIPTTGGSNLRLTGDWTLEAWVKPLQSVSNHHIIETYSTSGNLGGFILRISNGKVRAYQLINQATNYSNVSGTTTLSPGNWVHIAATLNETTQQLKVYLNGVIEDSTTTTITTLNMNNSLKIGARGDDNNVSGDVTIDNVRIWDFAKTEAQIQADTLACLTGNEAGLLAWYDFENVTNSTLTDKSAHGNNGTFVNYSPINFSSRIYTCHPVTSTSISEYNKKNINVYPNPTTSQLTLNTTDKIINVNIIDITGKTVKTITPSNNTIDVTGLVKGIYFLKLQTENGISNSKFIKE